MSKKPQFTPPEHAVVKANYDPKKKLAVASTDSVDRHNEVINQEGWDLEQFKANPVMLWAHDNYEPAIGYAENLQVVQLGDKKALTFTPVFHGKTELSAAIDALYNGDPETQMKPVLNSFSVGFRPLEADGNVYTKNELLEISCVNVPANSDARVLAYKGLVSKGISDRVAKDVVNIKGAVQDELDVEAVWEQKRELMDDVRSVYWAFCEVFFDEETPVTEFKTLLMEVSGLFSQIANGTYTSPVETDGEDEVVTESTKVLDKVRDTDKDVEDITSLAKGNIPSAPKAKVLSKRQMLAKAITRAADLIGESEKNNNLKPDQKKQLVKAIKQAGDKISASQKEELRNG